MEYKIRGTTMQVVDIQLSAGESVYSESGGMSWMSSNIDMQTDSKGGLAKGIGRLFSGESFFMNTFTCKQGKGTISFAGEFPGKVIAKELKQGESLLCQKDTFMVAQSGVNLEVAFQKRIGAGFFGGEGFILQKVTGPGLVFLETAGEITKYDLQKGQVLRIDPGYLAIMEPTVNYDIERVKGLGNIFFGKEGLFLATTEGPGTIWLQSMPIRTLAMKIYAHIPHKSS